MDYARLLIPPQMQSTSNADHLMLQTTECEWRKISSDIQEFEMIK